MGIEQIMQNALQAKWLNTDDFEFIFTNNAVPFPGGNAKDVFDMCTISLDTPQLSAEISPTLFGGLYKLHQTIFQPFTFSVVFRDQSKAELKSYFTKIWQMQQEKYFDDIKSTITISAAGTTVFKSEKCLISSISTSQFDNNNSQVSEFTVEFTSSHIQEK